jgi:hypothetical protein
VSDFAYGPDAGLPAGYARCAAGTTLWRGHTPGLVPGWFGPAIGAVGTNRFDAPVREAGDPGTCYLAAGLEGVLLERVLRGRPVTFVSRRTLAREHALARARLARDLVLVDLFAALAVHRFEVADIAAPPDLRGTPRYPRTQPLAAGWSRAAHPVPVDGIVYGSRFGPAAVCVALWDRAETALAWGPSAPLDADMGALVAACNRLGLGLLP